MIYFRPNEQQQTGQVLHLLAHGEALARDCAKRQAKLAPTAAMRRFLKAQARQESVHAHLFKGAVAMLVPKGVALAPAIQHMQRFREEIDASLDRGELVTSLLAQQVVLEGLGESILTTMDGGIRKRSYGFGGMRRMILRQEQAHHGFGLRQLRVLIEQGSVQRETLRDQGDYWIGMCQAMLEETGELTRFFDHDPAEHAQELRTELNQLLA